MAASSLDAFMWAIGQEESGGNYKAHNPSGALGKYQIMNFHLRGGREWAGQVFGHAVSEKEFLNSPAMQEQLARAELGRLYQKYGPAGAAAAWLTGSPDVNANVSDSNGTTPAKYAKNVLALMARAPANAGGGVSIDTGGTASATQATDATQASYSDDPTCLFGMNIPLVGGVCILSKGKARAIEGGLLLIAGGIVGGAGLIILAAYGLKATGALGSVASAAQVIPGAGGLAARAASASGALNSGPKPRQKSPDPTVIDPFGPETPAQHDKRKRWEEKRNAREVKELGED
jgi:hypothetical protein